MKLIYLVFMLIAFFCVSCATPGPEYIVDNAGARMAKGDAEATHAKIFSSMQSPSPRETLPKIILSPLPDYPDSLRKAGVVGKVVVRFNVELDGVISNPKFIGSAAPELEALVLRAIQQWKFVAATRDGVPVVVGIELPFTFAK